MDKPVLEVHKLSRSFGALHACQDISLDLREGEIHAIIGPNGAGKSTLMKLLAGELAPDSGDICLSGININKLSEEGRSQAGMARTFQVSSIIPEFTALQNLILAQLGQTRSAFRFFANANKDKILNENAEALLKEFGLADRAHLPVASISHGERRQLEVALALAIKPKILLMDEPMAGMGPDGSKRLTEQLKNLKSHAPILLIEHDMDAVFSLADRLSVLVYGKIIASGSVEEIRTNEAVREAYLGSEET